MDFDLDLLRYFVAVIDGGSLAAAAKALNASRATVRRNLADLEARAGTPLVLRGQERVIPTEAGGVVVTRARQLLAETSSLLDAANAIGNEPRGVVRVATTMGLPPMAARFFIAALRARWPRLRFDHVPSDAPHAELLERADIALTFERNIPPGPWEVHDVVTVREGLLASPTYLTNRGTPTTLEDLVSHDILVWRSHEGHPELLPILDGRHYAIEPILVSPDIHLLRRLAIEGAGIAYVPEGGFSQPDELPEALTAVLADVVGACRAVRLIVPRSLQDTPRTRAFAEETAKLFASRLPATAKFGPSTD